MAHSVAIEKGIMAWIRRGISLGCTFMVLSGIPWGCARKPAQPTSSPAAVVPPSTIGQTLTPVSDEEARDFAAKLIEGITSNNSEMISQIFDWNTLAERALEGVPIDAQSRNSAKATLLASLSQNNSMIQQIHRQLQNGGIYKLVRVHDKQGMRHALFRLVLPEGGVNYHDVQLSKSKEGLCRGLDIHIFLTGELLSVTLKRNLLQVAAARNRSFVDRLTGSNMSIVRFQAEILGMPNAINRGDGAEALRLYRQLPDDLRKDKNLLLLRLTAAQLVGDDHEYLQTMTDFRREYPQDACIDFLSIDYFLLRQNFDAALMALTAVERDIGGEPYLDMLHGNLLFQMQNTNDAEAHFRTSIEGDPDLQEAWWGLISCLLQRDDAAEVFSLQKEMDSRFIMEWQDLTAVEEYAGFVQSPYHQQWLDYLAQKPPLQPSP